MQPSCFLEGKEAMQGPPWLADLVKWEEEQRNLMLEYNN
jgi:hypothetical protein